jgi:hypothetical protein
LDDPRSFPSWRLLGELGSSMCIQADRVGLAQVAGLEFRVVPARGKLTPGGACQAVNQPSSVTFLASIID